MWFCKRAANVLLSIFRKLVEFDIIKALFKPLHLYGWKSLWNHKMHETRTNCFRSKKRSTTLRQAKTGKHKCQNVIAMLLLHWYVAVTFQQFKTPICGAAFFIFSHYIFTLYSIRLLLYKYSSEVLYAKCIYMICEKVFRLLFMFDTNFN